VRIGIVNQFAPPDESPTSVLAGELADHLRSCGHDVRLISCDGGYRNERKNRRGRLLHELCAHLKLFWKCLWYRKADVLLAFSSPACLPATVATAAWLKRCRFAHWAMDVYPEVAVSLGEITADGIVYKITSAAMRRAYRRAKPLVALSPRMAETIGEPAEICPPWPPTSHAWPDAPPSPSRPFTWLYSGNLGRAHLFRPILLAQQKLESRGIPAHLVFQGAGHSLAEARAFAEELGLENCHFRDYAPRDGFLESLFAANVLVATQAPETDGLLWPSKLAVMHHIPRPLLWVGSGSPSVEATTFSPQDANGIAGWIEQQLSDPPQISYNPARHPERSLELWNRWLTQA
jgi:colanic acid biosynthesis glycosyl transferase WcaI